MADASSWDLRTNCWGFSWQFAWELFFALEEERPDTIRSRVALNDIEGSFFSGKRRCFKLFGR